MSHEIDSNLVKEIRYNGCHQLKGDMIRWLGEHPKATALELLEHFCGTRWRGGGTEDGAYKEGQNFNP